MKLEPQQENVLRGESGRALASALQTLVDYGEAFGAQRLVPIKSGHLAGSFAILVYKAYYKILNQLLDEGVTVKVPTTTNPRPGNDLNLVNRISFGRQKKLDAQFAALGVTPNYSCVCYEGPNTPEFGDRLAWAESSAVQFANSAIGARTNRNSILIDVCSAVTGLTPEFGYLLDENRRAEVLVKLDIKQMDYSALGFIIGREVVDQVPVIEHFAIDRIGLKNMGGAMAAAGGVALFHVEGVTPEAPDVKSVLDGDPKRTITITQSDLDKLRYKNPDDAEMVVFGCPQMTYEEAEQTAQYFIGKQVKKTTWFCMIPAHKERFEKTEVCEQVKAAGVEIYDHCPLAALTLKRKRKPILSPSGKCYYYLDGSQYGNIDDCLKACGV